MDEDIDERLEQAHKNAEENLRKSHEDMPVDE